MTKSNTAPDRRSRSILWIAPNLNFYKAQFLDELNKNNGLSITVLAGAHDERLGHAYQGAEHSFATFPVKASKKFFAIDPRTYFYLFWCLLRRFDVVMMPIEKKHLPLIVLF
jgi:hypothetical protein